MSTKKLILVVEDEKLVRELLVKELNNHGYNTIEAEDGEAAKTMWEQNTPDLVLLDILLPKMNGFELMKTIRANPDENVNRAAVLVLSNLWEKHNIEEMSQYGVEDYLVKAYNTVADIISRIDLVFTK